MSSQFRERWAVSRGRWWGWAALLFGGVGLAAWLPAAVDAASGGASVGPYQQQAEEQLARLDAEAATERARGAEALGFLRYYPAEPRLIQTLGDAAPEVRREAALALGWCGGRPSLRPLVEALEDAEWSVRQAAWVALTNLTGEEFAFDALASPDVRYQQTARWSGWVAEIRPGEIPAAILAQLSELPEVEAVNYAADRPVEVSTTYVGGGRLGPSSAPGSLTDGRLDTIWMTKDVPFPQTCTIDLGDERQVGCVVIHQHPPFAMSDFSVEVRSADGDFQRVARESESRAATQVVVFPARSVRHVRVLSHDSLNPTYPTALLQVEVYRGPPVAACPDQDHQVERAVRALGALGGDGASRWVIRAIRPWFSREDETEFSAKRRVQAGIRALGRLGEPPGREALVTLLDNRQWARYAADALGDFGGSAAAEALLAAYPQHARGLNRPANPAGIHPSDRAGFDARDRIPAAPYAVAMSLSRIPLTEESHHRRLREIAPLLVANVPSDADALMVYDREPHQRVAAWLLEQAGLRQAVVDAAFEVLGRERRVAESEYRSVLLPLARGQLNQEHPASADDPPYAGNLLAAFCRDPQDVPLLLELLEHPNRWIRINATKALIFMGAREAVEPLARKLAESPPEAEYGFFAERLHDTWQVGQDEFNDPTPRDREAYVTALGKLGSAAQVPQLIGILFDERNVLEVRYAAARALDRLGTAEAVEALRQAESHHDFHTVRAVAREAIWRRDLPPRLGPDRPPPRPPPPGPVRTGPPTRFVFIKGEHNPYNTFRTDNWRQTHNTTDSGPVYRPGRNLYILDTAGERPEVTPLTRFTDGHLGDPRVGYDGRRVLFTRREQDSPWYHIYEIQADGRGLRQLTRGPYHDVSPHYLPDGRIVFSTTRLGTRDEYHGYPCTGLAVMREDGSDIQFIGFNLGRDADTVVGPDGNLLFARLEIFYARLKVEWNLLSAFPDGTRAVTLYGPERRAFWRQIDGGYADWGMSGLRHRVLRLSQPELWGPSRYVLNSPAGPILTQGRRRETILRPQQDWAITTPHVLDEQTLLVAAGEKPPETSRGSRPTDTVDLGLYTLDLPSGELTLVYNDPRTADFGARPLHARPRPPVIPASPGIRERQFTGTLYASSARISQLPAVRERGRLVRVIEGLPQVARHQTHTNRGLPWKNHGGAEGRVLGTIPLAADGSFAVEVPADRFLHLQVLDSDRYVVGNQLLWMYVRPGESKGCIGCHEPPDTAAEWSGEFPLALSNAPIPTLPTGHEQFRYRAKAWYKGDLPDEREERQRTVQSITLFGRN